MQHSWATTPPRLGRRRANKGSVSPIGTARYSPILVAALLASSCATTGATLNSGVGDAFLEHPPYYAGRRPASSGAPRTGHLPVTYQAGASQSSIFDPSHSAQMNELLQHLTLYLDSMGRSMRLAEGHQVSAVTHAATRVPPDVHFGCITETGVFGDDCAERGDSALGRKGQRMQLAVGRPSSEWVQWTSSLMEEQGVEQTLVVTLEVGQYLMRQRGLAGHKEVELGTAHTARLPWLTSLETPVSVIQLTGVLVGRDGKAIRIGAEGLYARRTTLPVSSLGGQALITDEDVAKLISLRRDDLPGAPLTWQVGLRALVDQLLTDR